MDFTMNDLESLYRNNSAHPNPMFDFVTGFVPRRLRDLFAWMEYLYYNSAQIFAALKKFSEYPITSISYNTTNRAAEDHIKNLLEKKLRVKDILILCGRDRWIYGNAFVSVYQPFVRFLKCQHCGKLVNIQHVNYRFKFTNLTFEYTCKKCKKATRGKVVDRRVTDPNRIHVIRWDPKQMDIDHNPVNGQSIYYYSIPPDLKNRIRQGNKLLLNTLPLAFIAAARDNKMFRFKEGQIYHMKVAPPAGIDPQWGFPPLTSTIKLFFYTQILRKANEAIALDHLVPFRIIFPRQTSANADPLTTISLARMFEEVKSGIGRWRKDPLTIMHSGIPIDSTQIGGDGRALLTLGEVKEAEDSIIAAMGIPREFIYGGLSFCMRDHTLIQTSQGLFSLKELVPNAVGTGQAAHAVVTRNGLRDIICTHRVTPKPVVHTQLRSGRRLDSSEEHRFWTLQKDLTPVWKRAADIKPGDYVAKILNANIWPAAFSEPFTPADACHVGRTVAEDAAADEVPRSIRQAPRNHVIEFLRAYFHVNPRIETQSRFLLEQIQALLQNLGIDTAIEPREKLFCLAVYPQYVPRWCEDFNFPFSAELRAPEPNAPSVGDTFVWDEVIASCLTSEIVEMADLSIDGTPEYLANGVVSHNTGSAITLRMLENQLLTYTSELNELLQWLTTRCTQMLGWPNSEVELTEFKLIDDVQQKQLILQLNQSAQMISNTTLAELNDFDLKKERKRRLQESLDEIRFQQELQTKTQQLQQSLAQQARSQALIGQTGLQYDQQQVIGQADQLVQELIQLDPGTRKSRLHALQTEDFVMYSVAIQRLEEMRNQATYQSKRQAQGF